jgi:chromosome segregation ATPase
VTASEALAQKKAQLQQCTEQEEKSKLQADKDATEIKRLRGLNNTLEKEMQKIRGELESAHTRLASTKVPKLTQLLVQKHRY